METGSNISDSNYKQSPDLKGTHLLAHLRYDGISLLVADSNRKQVIDLIEGQWPSSRKSSFMMDHLQSFLNENNLKPGDAESLKWLLSTSNFCLVPDVLYDQEGASALLQNTCHVDDDDKILSDFWSKRDIVQIYSVKSDLYNFLKNLNSNTTIAHNGYAINSLNNELNKGDAFSFLQVNSTHGELYIMEESKVIFFNQFPHNRPEDLLYYTLATLEQNRLLAPEITMNISGDVGKGEELQKLLTRYIGKVEDVKLPSGLDYASHLSKNELRKVVNLIAAL